MNIRREFIAGALTRRYREICGERLSNFAPADFSEHADFVSSVVGRFGKAGANTSVNDASGLDVWMETNNDCLTSIRQLALGQRLEVVSGNRSPTADFVWQLKEARAQPARRFQLLTQRYACPLNFAVEGEEIVREYVLERLMVQDRARIEQRSVKSVDSDDVLLRLNLIAIYAARTPDLRFIDALNYYYEMIPANWRAEGHHNWLQVSYLALYAQALISVAGRQ